MANKKALLTSHHVNYLIFRYLQEAGFTHTSFTFAHESNVIQAPLDPNSVAPGSLIALLQKGLQFLELEANLEGMDGDVDGEFKMLTPEELVSNDIDTLRQMVQERRDEERAGGRSQPAAKRRDNRQAKKEEKDKDKEKLTKQQEKALAAAQKAAAAATAAAAAAAAVAAVPDKLEGPAPMDEEPCTPQQELPQSAILPLQGHDAEICVCAWHPADHHLIATGSSDRTTRIWSTAPGKSQGKCVLVLQHDVKGQQAQQEGGDVGTLDWSPDGSLLATGTRDGIVRIWTKDGKLRHTLDKHSGPVLALKWNKKGDLLASGGSDQQTVVWDVKSGEARQTWEVHSGPVVDVEWRNNSSFASCSSDRRICVCRVGERDPQRVWEGHTDEVNSLRWDPTGAFLASGSDDHTARVWSMKQEDAVHVLRGHTAGIYLVRWGPPGSSSAGQPPLLATASFDNTVKLWELEGGKCHHTLEGHTQYVYACDFSPSGKHIATGASDRNVFVWSVGEGRLLKTCKGEAHCLQLSWSPGGDKLAACFESKVLWVLDMRSL